MTHTHTLIHTVHTGKEIHTPTHIRTHTHTHTHQIERYGGQVKDEERKRVKWKTAGRSTCAVELTENEGILADKSQGWRKEMRGRGGGRERWIDIAEI